MERRELLKSLTALPFVRMTFKGQEVLAVETSKARFAVFADPRVFNFDNLNEITLPDNPLENSVWFAVHPLPGASIEDSIRIYKTQE